LGKIKFFELGSFTIVLKNVDNMLIFKDWAKMPGFAASSLRGLAYGGF